MKTKVTTLQIPSKHNWYLLFGAPERTEYHHSSKRDHSESGARLASHYFEPGQIFGLSIQRLNDHGIVSWNSYILRAVNPGEPAHQVGLAVSPAAECLIPFPGKRKSQLAKRYLEILEHLGVDPAKDERLHRYAADYLLVGVIPDLLLNRDEFLSSSFTVGGGVHV